MAKKVLFAVLIIISLAVAGFAQPEIEVSGTSGPIADGGSEDQGIKDAGVKHTFGLHIQNAGTETLSVSSISVSSPVNVTVDPMPSITLELPPGTGEPVTINFPYRPVASLAFSFQIAFATNDPDEADYSITITGTGGTPDISIQGTVGVIADGGTENQGVKTPGVAHIFPVSIRNVGTGTLHCTSFSTSNPVNVTMDSLPMIGFTLPPDSEILVINVGYETLSTCPFSFQVDIVTDDPDEGAFDFTVTGSDDTTDPQITVCPPTEMVQCIGLVSSPDDSWVGFVAAGGAAFDLCDLYLEVSYEDSAPFGSCPTTILRTWTVTDDSGNSATCEQTILINDTTDPQITVCPPTETVQCIGFVSSPDDSWDGFVAAGGAATDNCDPDLDAGYEDSAPFGSCPTTIIRTWTVTDDCANTATCEQTITVNDTVDPQITVCPPTETVQCINLVSAPDDSWDGFVAAGGAATDNCDPDLDAGYEDSAPSGTCPTTIIRTWTVTDDCANTATCEQTILINDTTDPLITVCPPTETVQCINLVSSPDDSWDGFVAAGGMATDNCDPDLDAGYADGPATGDNPTTIIRTWTVTDDCANTATCEQTIIVNDTVPPVITLIGPDPQIVELGDAYTEHGADAADACCVDPLDLAIDSTAVETNTLGVYIVTYGIDDCAGNPATVARTVEVVDTTPPDIAILSPADQSEYLMNQVVLANWRVFDASGTVTARAPADDGRPIDTARIGRHDFVVSATDGSGNTSRLVVTYAVTCRLQFDPQAETLGIPGSADNAGEQPEPAILLFGEPLHIGFVLLDALGKEIQGPMPVLTVVRVVPGIPQDAYEVIHLALIKYNPEIAAYDLTIPADTIASWGPGIYDLWFGLAGVQAVRQRLIIE